MKILSSDQIQQADKFTIENEPIESIELMERASRAFVEKFKLLVTDKNCKVSVFCGLGNNGGDGLVIARMLHHKGRPVRVFSIGNKEKATPDFNTNLKKLPTSIELYHLETESAFPLISNQEVVVDALFGSGLSRPIEGLHAKLVNHLNTCEADIFSVDIASGLFADQVAHSGVIIEPTFTISFQVPKLVFFQPNHQRFVGEWHVVDIGLDEEFIESLQSPYQLTTPPDVTHAIPKRGKFSHKGDAGKMLLIAGSKGKMGAAVLAAQAAFRAGVGLLFVHSPSIGRDVLQISVPEAMVIEDEHQSWIGQINVPEKINGVSIGPGIGTQAETSKALYDLLKQSSNPMVIDADAINILAENPDWIQYIPAESILTPHPGEFERLVGTWGNDFQRLDLLREFCSKNKLNVVLKGAYSAVCNSAGNISFNPTGNAGMATAGSGDVLTGIVGSLLAQGCEPFDALRLGVYLHGLSGDLAEKKKGNMSLIASDLIDFLPKAILSLSKD
ncbi:MAG: NAD(P)H-hydrate dehydratase [Cyclobacteriaceae bacterium]